MAEQLDGIWDNLFESTSLNTNPNSPQAPVKAVVVAPSAQTAPAPSAAPKRARKSAKATAATPVPAAPDEPAADASIFFGAEDSDEVGTAGATAQAQATLEEAINEDDDEDLFGEDTDEIPAAPVTAPVPTEAKKAGRPKGSKKKETTAEEYVARMEIVNRGETLADPTFRAAPVEQPASVGAEKGIEALPTEVELLVRTCTRSALEEIAAFFRRSYR